MFLPFRLYDSVGFFCWILFLEKLSEGVNKVAENEDWNIRPFRDYTFSKKIGLAIISLNGEIMFHEPSFIPRQYDALHERFIRYDKEEIGIFQVLMEISDTETFTKTFA